MKWAVRGIFNEDNISFFSSDKEDIPVTTNVVRASIYIFVMYIIVATLIHVKFWHYLFFLLVFLDMETSLSIFFFIKPDHCFGIGLL